MLWAAETGTYGALELRDGGADGGADGGFSLAVIGHDGKQ